MNLRNILEVSNLSKSFKVKTKSSKRENKRRGEFKTPQLFKAVDDVSFSIRKGSTLGILGESGSGKSTLGRCVMRLIEPDKGRIRFAGQELTYLTEKEMREKRRQMQMIFQNTDSALNRKMTVEENIRDPLDIWSIDSPSDRKKKVRRVLDLVQLEEKILTAYPYEISGGQRQRVSIARALTLEPLLLICDEVISLLDVTIQNQIVTLLQELQQELGLTCIIISHNLAVVEMMSDEVLVMKEGKVCELSTTEEIYKFPKGEYTRELIGSVARIPSLEVLQARARKWSSSTDIG